MEENEINLRLMELEMASDMHQRMLDDLNDAIIRQEKIIERLQKQNEMLKEALSRDIVKPLSEKTPPPHY